MQIEIHVIIPYILARRIYGLPGLGFEITDVEIVALNIYGLIVAGKRDGVIYFAEVTPQTFFTWATQAFQPDLMKFMSEIHTSTASDTVWAENLQDLH